VAASNFQTAAILLSALAERNIGKRVFHFGALIHT
jgi:hypothetical protein